MGVSFNAPILLVVAAVLGELLPGTVVVGRYINGPWLVDSPPAIWYFSTSISTYYVDFGIRVFGPIMWGTCIC